MAFPVLSLAYQPGVKSCNIFCLACVCYVSRLVVSLYAVGRGMQVLSVVPTGSLYHALQWTLQQLQQHR
jgi:gamma-glutamyl-gamma-aminobutyrate hydrolase PuuD